MEKIDLRKEYKHLFKASAKKASVVEVPVFNYLMVDGKGDPNTSQEFQEAVEALYSLSYTIKFTIKKSPNGVDFTVMPLEGLWWCDDMEEFTIEDKSNWKWILMILQPEFVNREIVEKATEDVRKKKNPAALLKIRFEKFEEGLSAQIMHKGPYSEEGPTVDALHKFIKENGYSLRGKHHEIYLSDPRRSKPENMKTILRQPVDKL